MRLSNKSFPLSLQPTSAWTAILGLIIFILFALLARVGIIAWLFYYLGSFAVGIFLYTRYPILYIGFTLWLWFVGPFIKRLIDYQGGYNTPGAWTLIPLLVASIPFVTLVRYLPRFLQQSEFPFILGCASVTYGFLIQLIKQPLRLGTITIFLTWLAPILFGFHLCISWRYYPSYRQNIQRVFLWGVIVMGAYGIWQFFAQPPWDALWLKDSCECFQDRLWSTMLTPFTFSAFMMAGLILLFSNQTTFKFPAAIVGYLSFLLTLVRSAWLSWLVSLVFLLPSLKARLRQRVIVSIMVMTFLCLPLISIEPFSEIIGSRIMTFSNLTSDRSYQLRLEANTAAMDQALVEFVGKGLSATVTSDEDNDRQFSGYDGGVLWILFSLGWFGTIPYLAGIVLLFFKSFQDRENHSDIFAITVRSIAVSVGFLASIGFPGIIGADGMILIWGFLGIVMASQKYYKNQRLTGTKVLNS